MRALPHPQDVTSERPESLGSGSFARRCARLARALGAMLATVLAATLVVALPSAPASAAAKGSDFDAGNIITDEVFFDGRALSASQVQAFLKQKVPTCLAKAGNPDCLRNYRMDTPTRAKDAYCKKYTGSKNERASAIIAKVAKACGVSAKVILVLLQKEQSLVTSTAPTEYQYERATGFACPDTAPCDEQYFGFFNQVYHAARQYQRYADRSVYSWRKIGKNKLPYHPKAACGTVEVNIKNQATLGLYFYTPYVPNAAALANMYGTGDECSSYGNRNFWRGFTDWFGSTRFAVTGDIQKAWLAAGGVDGVVGVQRASQVCHKNGKYCVQKFQRGTVAKGKKSSFLMTGVIEKAWRKAGAHKSALAWPYSAQSFRKADGSTLQRFTGGYLVDSRYGTREVLGELAKLWRKNKERKGKLGLPTGKAKCAGAKKDRCVQAFKGGYISAHPKKGNFTVTGKIATYWKKKKLQKGSLGFPTSKAKCPKEKGVTTCRQSFGKTRVVSSSKLATRVVKGDIAKVWDAKRSSVGNPVKNQKCSTKGKGKKKVKTCSQEFTKGWISSSSKLGTFFVSGKFATLYSKNLKKLGTPTSNRSCKKKSGTKTCTQTFTKGKIVQKGNKKPKIRT